MCVFWSIAFFFFYMPPRKPEHVSWPEFNIISTLPRRSSTSQLEFVGIKTLNPGTQVQFRIKSCLFW